MTTTVTTHPVKMRADQTKVGDFLHLGGEILRVVKTERFYAGDNVVLTVRPQRAADFDLRVKRSGYVTVTQAHF